MNTTAESTTTRSFLAVLLVGLAAGVLAGITMLVTMGILRMAFGWPTPTELIFDRLFPFPTVEFFISSLVKAGGYTPLKLEGVFGALAGQVAVAAIGGVIYSWYMNRLERRQASDNAHHGIVDARGWRLIGPWSASGGCVVRNLALADFDHELTNVVASSPLTLS
jgi:hypothetical protein